MRATTFAFLVGAFLFFTPAVTPAAVVYFEDFDTDSTAEWSINQPGGVNASDNFANVFFDYSTSGISSAPNSVGGTTRGLKLEANVSSGVFSGISASPIGQSFAGNYVLRADVWQNFNGPFPAGGNGSTQVTWGGIGTDGTTPQFPGTSVQGVGFGATGDGGSAQDYRAYTNAGAPLAPSTGAYAAGTTSTPDVRNAADPYYVTAGFGGEIAPAAQLTAFPQQTGATGLGTQGMAWHEWEIRFEDNVVTWSIDDVLLATVDVTNEAFGGSNFFFGQFDINATSSSDVNDRSLLFGLVDNVRVETIEPAAVPEPTSVLLLALTCVVGLARFRRRRT